MYTCTYTYVDILLFGDSTRGSTDPHGLLQSPAAVESFKFSNNNNIIKRNNNNKPYHYHYYY